MTLSINGLNIQKFFFVIFFCRTFQHSKGSLSPLRNIFSSNYAEKSHSKHFANNMPRLLQHCGAYHIKQKKKYNKVPNFQIVICINYLFQTLKSTTTPPRSALHFVYNFWHIVLNISTFLDIRWVFFDKFQFQVICGQKNSQVILKFAKIQHLKNIQIIYYICVVYKSPNIGDIASQSLVLVL